MLRDLTPTQKNLYSGLIGHRFSVMRLAKFHFSDWFASCSFDGTVRIWNGKNQEKVLFNFSEAIEGLEVMPNDSAIIVILADTSKAYIYNLLTDSIELISDSFVFRNIFGTNPCCQLTAFATYDDEIHFYNHKQKTISGNKVLVENLSGDSLVWIDDRYLVVSKRNGQIVIIDSQNRTIFNEILVHDGLITSMCLHRSNLVTVSEDGTGKILDLDFNPQFGFKIDFTPLSVDFNSNIGIIAVTGERNLLIVDTKSREVLSLHQELSGSNVIILSSGEILKGTEENNISLFTLQGDLKSKILGRFNSVESAVFLDENQILFGSGDKKVHLLDFRTGKEQILAVHNESISSIIYLSIHNLVIAGSYDDSISIWDLTRNSLIKKIKDVPLVSVLASNPSQEVFIAACSGDNSIRVFSLDGIEINSWEAHTDYIRSVRFMNDDIIISGSDDKSLKFWKKDGKLLSSITLESPIRVIETVTDLDFYITGHLNGELNFYEKISNRRRAHHKEDLPIQQIKIIDPSTILYASQNRLISIMYTGSRVEDHQEICQHIEPIKAIKWLKKPKKVISVGYSVDINETIFSKLETKVEKFTKSEAFIEFAPTEQSEREIIQNSESLLTTKNQNIESLENILDYLKTISSQMKDLIIPNLQDFNIDAIPLSKEVESLLNKVNIKLEKTKKEVITTSEIDPRVSTEEAKSSNWKSIDWGKKRQSNK